MSTKRWVVEEKSTGKWVHVGHTELSIGFAVEVVASNFGKDPNYPIHIIEQTLAPIPGLDGATEVVGERVVWESGRKEAGE